MNSCSSAAGLRPHLGTLVEVRVQDAPQPRAALEAAFSAVSRAERLMSCHDAASELSSLNRMARTAPVEVDPWTYAVFGLALQIYRESDGAFDCTVGGRQVADGRLPPRSACALDPRASSADIVLFPPNRIFFSRSLHADLGGIAKGFAVDRAIDALQESGARAGAVNAGGDLRAFGGHAEPVHVRLPGNRGAVRVGELSEGALATSTTGAPPLDLPLLDPCSARPPARRLVSVFAPTCAVADALTKVVALRGCVAAPLVLRFGAEALIFDGARRRWRRIARFCC